MECLGTQNHKNPEMRTLKKTATSRDRKICILGHRGVGVIEGLLSLKITTIPEIVHMAPRASKMTVRASKKTARASKIIENLITLLTKIKTLAVKQARRSEQAKETKRSS